MDRNFFRGNRQRLIEVAPADVVVLAAYTQTQRSGDAAHRFEQEANFWWLSGIDQADWRLIIDVRQAQSWLVAPAIDDIHVVFDGGLSPDAALAASGVDGVLSHSEAAHKLAHYATIGASVATLSRDPHAKYYNFVENPAPRSLYRSLMRQFGQVTDARPALAKLRAIKQPAEIAAMQAAIDTTIAAFCDSHDRLNGFRHEYEIEAEFSYYFRRHGATGHAYDPIVAAGEHACTLHYDVNDGALPDNGLLLLDIGARQQGYAADITRTYALGTPTPRQIQVHQAVADAERQIIGLIQPGGSVKEYQQAVDRIMKIALQSIGFDVLADSSLYRRYFPHAISHGLGVDVHDSLGAPETFAPGMVLTVEPGIYIPEEGIGVRIEDDILVTETGTRNLSVALSTDL